MKKLRRVVAIILSLVMVLGSMTNVLAAKEDKVEKKGYKFIAFNAKTAQGSTIKKFNYIEVSNDGGETWTDVTGKFSYKRSGAYENMFVSDNNKIKIDDDTMFRMEMVLKNGKTAYSELHNFDNYVNGISYYHAKKISDGGLRVALKENPYANTKYTVSFDAEDDVMGMPEDVTELKNGTEYTVTSVEPTREGYTFVGWSYNDRVYKAGDTITINRENIKLTAVWEENSYTVEFVDGDGNVISSQVVGHGEEITAPAGPAKKDVKIENGTEAAKWSKFTFAKWVAEGDYNLDDLASVEQDMTFKANYTEKKVEVLFFVLNRGVAQKEEPGSHSSDDFSKGVKGSLKYFKEVNNNDAEVKNTIFEAPSAEEFGIELKEGETIKWYVVKKINSDKWHIDGIIVGQQYQVEVEYIDAKTKEPIRDNSVDYFAATEDYNVTLPEIEGYELVDKDMVVSGVMPYENVKATVEYQKLNYTVTYKVDGEVVKEYTVEYGSEVPVYEYEVAEGYNFTGFELVTEVEESEVVKQDMVFEGTTEIKTFTVTYKVNEEVVDEFIVEYGNEVPVFEYEVEEGYEFTGFELVTEVEDATVVKENMVFEGTATIKTFTVTYKVNGEVVDEFTVEYGSEVPVFEYEVEEGYDFTGFKLVTDVVDATTVKQDMVFEGTATIKVFTVTYYLNGEVYHTSTATYGAAKEMIGSPAGESHNFSGWTCVEGDLANIVEDVVIVGSTSIKTFTVTYKVNGEEVETFTVDYGSEVPVFEYEVEEGYDFTGFELVTEVEDATVVKQDMVFEGTTSLIEVEEEEEEDIDIDTPFAPGTPEDEVEEDTDNEEDVIVDVEDDTEAEEEEEEDIDIDTPFAPGVNTGDASNYTAYIAVLLIAAVGAMVIAYNKKNAMN